MAKVIEKHALEHKKKNALTEEETDQLRDNLIAQIFKLAVNEQFIVQYLRSTHALNRCH